MSRTRTATAAAVAASFACALPAAHAAENLTAETTSVGSSPQVSISYLAEVAGEAGIANLQVQGGQTLTNTVINVAEGKTDIGSTPLILPFLLKLGRGPYSKQGEKGAELAANLRALSPYSFGSYTLFTFESTGIKSFDQLKGKTIYNGPPRGGALIGARQVLQIVAGLKEGEGYKGVQVNWGQAVKTVMDGTADANILPATFPSPRVSAGTAAGKINIISVPKDIWDSEKFQKFASTPGNAPVAIKGTDMGYGDDVTLISEDGMFRSVNITGADIVNKSMSNDVAKALTAVYIKEMDKLMAKTPFAKNLGVGVLDAKLSGFCGAMPLKYHPGAVVAWQEAGYTVPDCAK